MNPLYDLPEITQLYQGLNITAKGKIIEPAPIKKMTRELESYLNRPLYSNFHGEYRIIEVIGSYKSRNYVNIQFRNTGTIVTANFSDVSRNIVSDPYNIGICGIARCGIVPNRGLDPLYTKKYAMYGNIIRRCYNQYSDNYKDYGAKGVRVCNEWLTFSNFYYQLPYVKNYNLWLSNPSEYFIDKDIYQNGDDRIYSLSTCCFVTRSENNFEKAQRNAKGGSRYVYVTTYRTGTYKAEVNYNRKHYPLGVYSNEIAAASIANIFIRINHLPIPLNNIPNEMKLYEALSYRKYTDKYLPIEICNVIDNSQPYTSRSIDEYSLGPAGLNGVRSFNDSPNFGASVTINGKSVHLGTFTNPLAAAVVRDHYCITNNINTKLNNITALTYEEALKYKVG